MNLESEIRNKMRAGAVSGLLWGITPLIWFVIWDLNVGLVGEILAALAFFAGAVVYEYEAHKIPRLVAEVEKELSKVREQTPPSNPSQEPAAFVVCPQCKYRIPSVSKFCLECGADLRPSKTTLST